MNLTFNLTTTIEVDGLADGLEVQTWGSEEYYQTQTYGVDTPRIHSYSEDEAIAMHGVAIVRALRAAKGLLAAGEAALSGAFADEAGTSAETDEVTA